MKKLITITLLTVGLFSCTTVENTVESPSREEIIQETDGKTISAPNELTN